MTLVDGRQFVVCRGADRHVAFAITHDDRVHVFIQGEQFEIEPETTNARRPLAGVHTDVLMSPMPATVTRLLVTEGDRVENGQTLALLEAMKMELPIRAPRDGVVSRISCRQGELVQPQQALIELE